MFVERWRSVIVVGLLVLALQVHTGPPSAGALASPAAPSDAGASDEAELVGAFGLGDALEATIDPRTGAFVLEFPVPGSRLRWASSLAGVDRFGLGAGWGLVGVPFVDVHGGARAFLTDGRVVEVGEAAVDGVVFARAPGTLPARPDGAARDREYEYTLAEPGGRRTFFGIDGDALAAVDAAGGRDDWLWADGHRLVARIDELGVVRRWTRAPSGRVHITSHIGEVDASRPVPPAEATTFDFDEGRLVAVTGPTGTRVEFEFTRDGLLASIDAESGALTRVEWQLRREGTAAVRRVRVVDATDGDEVLVREWAETDLGSRTATTVAEGATRVVSEYAWGRLDRRTVTVRFPFGERVVRELELAYPESSTPRAASGADRLLAAQPISSTLRFTDGARSRAATTRYTRDRSGRITRQAGPDGTVVETDHDEMLIEGAEVPTGHPLRQRRTAPDGLIQETRHTLDSRRVAPIVTETFAGRAGGELQRTGRTEFSLRSDGSVAELREFPQGGQGVPRITRFGRDIDRAAGTIATTETIAVGTPSEASNSETVDLVNGAVIGRVDELGRIERVQVDAAGRAVRRTDLAGRVTELSYRTARADGGNAVVESSPTGLMRTVESDALGRPVRRTDNLAGGAPRAGHVRVAELRAYPAPGTDVVTDAWGATTTTRRDASGRVVEVARPDGVSELTRYDDALGTVTTGRSATGDLDHAEATVTTSLDERGEVVGESEWRLDGEPTRTVERTVDGLGREVRVDDGLGVVTTAFDPFGNAVETARAGPAGSAPITAHRTYDGFGASLEKTLVREADARSGGARTLDARGRLVAETDQSGGVTTCELAPDGLVLRETTSYGRVTVNTYDPVSRALVETLTTSPIGDPVHRAFEVDAGTGALRSAYDPRDRAATEIAWTRDAFGGVTSTRYPDGARIEHEYDEHGRRVATVDVSGAESRFDYDDAGRLAGVVRRAADGRLVAGVRYSRDELGRLTRIERENGAVTRIDSTSLGQVAAERTLGPGGAELSARAYRYDARGNLIMRTDRVSRPAAGGPTSRRTDYRYDADDRLIGSVVREGEGEQGRTIRRTEYELTVSGDVSREVIVTGAEPGSGHITVREFAYAPTGELLAVTQDGRRTEQRFDAAGNLVSDRRGTTYRYDAGNRPVAATDSAGETTLTTYWADARRAAVAAGADETRFYWDDATLLNDAHTQDGASGVAGYLLGVRRHARTVDDHVQHLVHDRHGSTVELLDGSGAITESYAYSDYGAAETATVSSDGSSHAVRIGDIRRNPFRWAGEYTDVTGMQHLSVRAYAPTELRFTTRDTAALHNRYAFGDGNPVMQVDPTGRAPMPDWAEVMDEPWFKILTTALSVALTLVGFLAITPLSPQAAEILSYAIGHYGGIAGSVVQAIGTAIMTVDTVDSLLETKFLNREQSGLLRITATVLTLGGGVASGGFKMLRKVANDDFQRVLDANDLRILVLERRIEQLTGELVVARAGMVPVPGVPVAGVPVIPHAPPVANTFVGAY